MRILVTGANGQVGRELLRALSKEPSPSFPLPAEGGGQASVAPPNTPFGTKGVAPQARGGDAGSESHPPQSPFLRKGEEQIVIPATRGGRLDDGTPCERVDLADPDDLRAVLDRIAPDLIVNPAAYTAVDRAEDEPELAQRVNGDALGVLGAWAQRHDARVVHYSTDYVFDGTAHAPYREDGATHPVSVYGRSKLAGEIALRDSGARHLIFRTAWVYAAHGKNFLLTMLRLGAERDELCVVDDQVGAPTPAGLIADVTAQAITAWRGDAMATRDGTYHLVASGQVTWCGFARAIFERAVQAGLLDRAPRVDAITSADYPTRATRPAFSVLDTARLRAAFGVAFPDWQIALDSVVDALRDGVA